jgi:hypothetical protein
VFKRYNYFTICRHISLLCYWVSASCGDLSSGEESLRESIVKLPKKVAKKNQVKNKLVFHKNTRK